MTDHHAHPSSEPVRSKKHFWIGGLLLGLGILCLGLMAALLLSMIIAGMHEGESFVVPGSHTIVVEEPATYQIDNVLNGSHEGTFYAGTQNLPADMRVTVTDAQSGQQLSVYSPSFSSETTIGSTHRTSLLAFDAPAPGQYDIIVAGSFAGDQLFHTSPAGIVQMFVQILVLALGTLLGFLAVGAGIVVLILGIIRRANHAKTNNPQHMPRAV